jgi:nucleoside-diphosphate-sugar epimerase
MKSISILGCGWVGMALGADLSKKGYLVKGSTTQESKFESLQSAGIAPYLIHFNPSLVSINAGDFFDSDVLVITIPPRRKSGLTDAYLQQLDSIATHVLNGTTRKIIFISSTSVYPEQNTIVTEQDADTESYLYKAESILRLRSELKTTVVRFGGLIGPGRHPGNFLTGKKELKGANNPVNIIHQQDCIEIIRTIIDHEMWGEVFNACSDRHPTKKEFYTAASIELGLNQPEFSEDDNSPFKVVSCEKLKRLLNYRFIH